MKKFVFSLSQVLNFEVNDKRQMMNRLIALDVEILSAKEGVARLDAALNEETTKLFDSGKPLKVIFLNDYLQYKAAVEKKMSQYNLKVARLNEQREELRALIIDSEKRIDMLDKLKEKRFSEYTAELLKEEERKIQETVETRYIIKQNGM